MYIIDLLTNGGSGITREGMLNVGAFVVALLFALIFHEVAHGLVALWFGDSTAKSYGRLSLNPAKHFDWIGLLMMLFCGFGWARPVPVNVSNFKKQKAGMICVSLAGVVTNLLLAFLFAGLVLGMAYVQFVQSNFYLNNYYFWYFLFELGKMMMSLNISFALFNLLPLYPLDGYRLMSCFVPQENAFMTFLRKYSLYIIIGLVLLSNLLPQFSPIDYYIHGLGEKIYSLFISFWGLFIK